MWDERYATPEYVYGTAPNAFLAAHASELQGPVLSIAEGEGRNAVFLAEQGLEVLGVDASAVGLTKALALAAARGVHIDTEAVDLAEFVPAEGRYGAVVSIFAHLPSALRAELAPRLLRALRPGGLLLLEAYAQGQRSRDTGGPKDPDLLMSVEAVQKEYGALEPLLLQEIERDVTEGVLHTGPALVVQFIGRRR